MSAEQDWGLAWQVWTVPGARRPLLERRYGAGGLEGPPWCQEVIPGGFRSGAVWAAEPRVGLLPGAPRPWSGVPASPAGSSWCHQSALRCKLQFAHQWRKERGLPTWRAWQRTLLPLQETREMRFDPWARKISWRRAWPPAPVFLPGESPGRRSLGDPSLQAHIGWDATEAAAPACVEERAGTEVSGLLGSHFGSDAASLI